MNLNHSCCRCSEIDGKAGHTRDRAAVEIPTELGVKQRQGVEVQNGPTTADVKPVIQNRLTVGCGGFTVPDVDVRLEKVKAEILYTADVNPTEVGLPRPLVGEQVALNHLQNVKHQSQSFSFSLFPLKVLVAK